MSPTHANGAKRNSRSAIGLKTHAEAPTQLSRCIEDLRIGVILRNRIPRAGHVVQVDFTVERSVQVADLDIEIIARPQQIEGVSKIWLNC